MPHIMSPISGFSCQNEKRKQKRREKSDLSFERFLYADFLGVFLFRVDGCGDPFISQVFFSPQVFEM